ncbi:hypothetical protein HYT92_00020 [Candidatus Pacearchaeota archaeon]|nr:hypothetical protein [Candidatus Pacearchaeota archaeon]
MSREDAKSAVGLLAAVIFVSIILPISADAIDFYFRKRKAGAMKTAK